LGCVSWQCHSAELRMTQRADRPNSQMSQQPLASQCYRVRVIGWLYSTKIISRELTIFSWESTTLF
jgi:hypothetical protein